MRVVARYEPSFGKPGSWILNDRGDGVRARLKLGEGPEHVIDFRVRWRGTDVSGRVFASPLTADMDTWVTESSTFDGQLGVPVVLQLNDCPVHVAEAMRGW